MPPVSPLVISFDPDHNLCVRANMTGMRRTFSTGKRGYLFREPFDWDGRRWFIKFQAFVMADRGETTLGLLDDVFKSENWAIITEPELPARPGSSKLTAKLEELARASMERQKRLSAG